jgi:hypothetical protein
LASRPRVSASSEARSFARWRRSVSRISASAGLVDVAAGVDRARDRRRLVLEGGRARGEIGEQRIGVIHRAGDACDRAQEPREADEGERIERLVLDLERRENVEQAVGRVHRQ